MQAACIHTHTRAHAHTWTGLAFYFCFFLWMRFFLNLQVICVVGYGDVLLDLCARMQMQMYQQDLDLLALSTICHILVLVLVLPLTAVRHHQEGVPKSTKALQMHEPCIPSSFSAPCVLSCPRKSFQLGPISPNGMAFIWWQISIGDHAEIMMLIVLWSWFESWFPEVPSSHAWKSPKSERDPGAKLVEKWVCAIRCHAIW